MAVTKRVRYEVLRRDNNTCRYCGGRVPDVVLTVDHVVPTALGGSDDPSNLVAACKDCNAGKSSSSPDASAVAQVNDDAVRWAAAMQAAAERYRLSRKQADALHTYVYDEWESYSKSYRRGRAELPDDFENTVDSWVRAGAPVELIEEAIAVAMRNKLVDTWNVWRYACGVVWTRLAQMQEEAKADVAPAEPAEQSEYGRGVADGMDTAYAVPSMNYGNLMFRTLARVVDGYGSWNHRAVIDGAL